MERFNIMDMYKSTYDGTMIDLDDMSNYPNKWKEMDIWKLWKKAWEAAGKSLFYMKYLNPEMEGKEQWSRVHNLCIELNTIWRICKEDNDVNRLIYMKWLYRFQDEVENQC